MLQGLSAAAVLGLVGCSSDSSVLPSSQASSTSESSSTATVAAGEVAISFTYTANSSSGGGGGMVRNPYIAVWVEDSAGALVKTISVWHLQNGQDRWLSELAKWYALTSGDTTSSGATRAPGSYTLAWDGTNSSGTKVSNGTYTIFIEAIREHGPYSVTSTEISVTGKAINQKLSDNNEISSATVTFQP